MLYGLVKSCKRLGVELCFSSTFFTFLQGRCIWLNPVAKAEDEFEEEEGEEEQEDTEEPQPETGPPLLASVNEDDGSLSENLSLFVCLSNLFAHLMYMYVGSMCVLFFFMI